MAERGRLVPPGLEARGHGRLQVVQILVDAVGQTGAQHAEDLLSRVELGAVAGQGQRHEGFRPGEPAVEPLLRALRDEHWDVRRRAAWELGNIGDPAVKPLIHALNDERWDVRRKAAWALGNIKAPQAIEPLIHTLEDERADVREQAAWALGALRDLRAVEPLIQALTDENSGVRREVARSLAVLTIINKARVKTKIHDHESTLDEQKHAAFLECKKLYEQELEKARVKRAA